MTDSLSQLLYLKAQRDKLNAEIKVVERRLFDEVEQKREGTSHGDGYKVIFKVNRKLDIDAYRKIAHHIPKELDPIVHKLTLDLKTWRKLEEEHATLAWTIVTESPGAPTLKIVEPEDGN